MSTLKELLDGKDPKDWPRVKRLIWPMDQWFQPIFKDGKGAYHGLTFCGLHCVIDGSGEVELYIEPKKKVVRWLWAFQHSPGCPIKVGNVFCTDAEMENRVTYSLEKITKLEWTRTEFEE